ncbi:expressed unknown protein [Seminavis robusta]|uniref:Uncharacterized protein n=1 Tax=Seminavis robusta TaxID=568900 RepID=A0A9N8EZW3_9STRA|nr:expressed unknown protein [Seminavis robusta]|eukprot:Sro2068_g313360.1 n/a (143) ;mRNA; f:16841-17269
MTLLENRATVLNGSGAAGGDSFLSAGDPHHASNSSKTKHVGFDRVQVRLYPIVLGDHPFCSTGCPIALGWKFSKEEKMKVDEYEASRPKRAGLEDLRISGEERNQLLSRYSEMEKQRVERDIYLARRRRRRAQLANRFMMAY